MLVIAFAFKVNVVLIALTQPVVEFLTDKFPVNVAFDVALAGTAIVIVDVVKFAFVTARKLLVGETFHVILY